MSVADAPVRHEYDALFFDYVEETAGRSARAIVPLVVGTLGSRSALDVGCGAGAWLSVYRACGVTDVIGADGDYVDQRRLLIPRDTFRALDVSQPFELGRRFDLVQCLEVGEHVPQASSHLLVANLVRHGSCVLFSAAVPGQGGEHHINEQPHEFWRGLFAEHGFVPYDYVRPRIQHSDGVAAWYAYNTILYVHRSAAAALPLDVARTRLADGIAIPMVWPLAYRLRAAVLRRLPTSVVTRLAVLRHHVGVGRRTGTR